METLTVTRGDLTLNVIPTPDADLWDFWALYAAGQWEPETFEILDRFLRPDATYVDLGAWVGPTVLYAASRCRKVIAVEPDPVALNQLRLNLSLNRVGNVGVVSGAVDSRRGGATLFMSGRWGDSMSSLMAGSESVEVPTWRLADLLPTGPVCLVKIDIEGAEARVLPDAVGILEERRIPCVVSLHQPLWGPGGEAAVNQALGRFGRVTTLKNTAPWEWRTVVAEWE